MNFNTSVIEQNRFKDIDFLIKRDDLLHPDFSGNKARKFAWFLKEKFPDIKRVISYGSSQSNAMYSLSVLAKMRGWEFDYYVDHISSFLKQNPHGNYLFALKNDMNIFEKPFPKELPQNSLFIHEGGRQKEAAYGIKILAKEIKEQLKDNERVDVFLPSGTGTTALFLQKYLPYKVYTTPCVGSETYLKDQFSLLESDESLYPVILNSKKRYHFGKLYSEFFKIWIELKEQTGIEFDLLYDPKGWLTLLENIDIFENRILYIHQGGILGNISMIKRYERKIDEHNR